MDQLPIPVARPTSPTHGSTTNTSLHLLASGGGGGGGGGGQSPTGGTIAITGNLQPGRKRRPARRLAGVHLLRIGRRRIPDAQLGLPDRFRLPAYGSPHGGTQVTGTTSVNDFLSGQANGSRHATPPFLTQAATYTTARHPRRMDQLPIPASRRRWWRRRRWPVPHRRNHCDHRPVGNADQNSDLQVSISYASGGGGYQTLQLGLPDRFRLPAYGSPGGTQVTGPPRSTTS